MEITIKKWKDGRFFAIYLNNELLAVTVYKKGAIAIGNKLCEITNTPIKITII